LRIKVAAKFRRDIKGAHRTICAMVRKFRLNGPPLKKACFKFAGRELTADDLAALLKEQHDAISPKAKEIARVDEYQERARERREKNHERMVGVLAALGEFIGLSHYEVHTFDARAWKSAVQKFIRSTSLLDRLKEIRSNLDSMVGRIENDVVDDAVLAAND
jgi:hypothetical protein